MKHQILLSAAVMWAAIPAAVQAQQMNLQPSAQRSASTFQLGTSVAPDGSSVTCDSKSLLLNGMPWLPVMGEFHFSRVPRQDWHRELLKMKAGGVNVVATYIFWIHHEEEEGIYDWSGQRDLHAFVEECKKVDLPVVLRVGPFCHGEVRNGGFPDWVIRSGCRMRSTDQAYLNKVAHWFNQIFAQVNGLQWKDGGPIVGIQVENECRGPWPYMMALKGLLDKTGFDAPIYTRTGWPQMQGKVTFGQLLPLYGDYADGFWDRSLKDMPGDYPGGFTFRASRLSTVIANEQLGEQSTAMSKSDLAYPYFTCELGGGMMTSYSRRINIFPQDALALAVCKVGSGSNLPGYYMYHGGTNPDGKHMRLNEDQSSLLVNYNELPVKTYDFQAPLGEMGQPGGSYAPLRRFHQLLADFGDKMSGMDAQIPAQKDGLRWSVRSDGKSGFIFVNNYERLKKLGDKQNVSFSLTKTDGSKVKFPKLKVLDGESFVMPFGLQVGEAVVDYATAQPFCILRGEKPTLVLSAIRGIKPVVKFAKGQKTISVRILSAEESLMAQKIDLGNRDTLIVSPDIVYRDGEKLIHEQWKEGEAIGFSLVKAQDAKRELKNGERGVPLQPSDQDFEAASVWKLTIPENMNADGLSHHEDAFVRISYEGDVARVYADGKLIEDNFWNGKPMYVRLSELRGHKVELRILPFHKDYPVYLQPAQRELLQKRGGSLLKVNDITIVRRITDGI